VVRHREAAGRNRGQGLARPTPAAGPVPLPQAAGWLLITSQPDGEAAMVSYATWGSDETTDDFGAATRAPLPAPSRVDTKARHCGEGDGNARHHDHADD
jgi:hypothetical protein